MYSSRGHQIRNFVLTFIAGWLFAQVFTISPKSVPFNLNQPAQTSKQK